MTNAGDVGTEIAPEVADDPGLAAAHRRSPPPHLQAGTSPRGGLEQAALKVDLDGDGHAARKFFNLSERYSQWRDYSRAIRAVSGSTAFG